ncbi:peptidyl-prolyl cis-trans isomerase [Borreliella lusitaniae]|uniref:peptidylprolyl isomerase n=1 Tax=Borreliella lusitaniae TaxID=100177 RepID=UPI00292D0C7B|nr:peptidyl-prolyl cis-trans isomerase [Borreliella lusitaniae]WNY66432.1 peptidyl-prolyl cis-trans isomerase [Borreliella lusitaniae]
MRKRSRKVKDGLVMLESKEKKVGIWGIFALILIVFGFIIAPLLPGVFDNANSSGLKFGSYKGQPIYYEKDSKFAKYVNYYSNLYSRLQGNAKNFSIDYSVWYLAFMKYAEDIAFLDLIKKYNFYISKEMLNKNLLRSPEYLDSSGNFSSKRYNKASDYQKVKIYDDMVENILFSNIKIFLNSNLIFPDSLFNLIKDMSALERHISYLSLSYQNFPNQEAVFYAEKNLNLFKRLSLASIRFKNISEARNAYEKLLNKTPFEELAKLYSDDIANFKGVVSLDKYYFDLDLIVEDKEDLSSIFSLREGEFSKPIKIKNKDEYQIYKAFGNVHDFDKNADRDISSVKNYIETYEPSVIENYLENKLNDFLSDVKLSSLSQAIEKYQFSLKEEIVNLSYNINIYPNTLKELVEFNNSKSFYDIVFGLKENSWSKPFVANKKVYLFFLKSAKKRSDLFKEEIKNEKLLDNFNVANSGLITDFLLNKKDFVNNFNESFFALQNFSQN